MIWVELFLKSKHLRETRLLMKIYKFWQTFRSGDDLTDHFIQLLHCRAEKLLPREYKLSCPRLYKAGKADTERLQASQVSPHPVLSTLHFYSIIFHAICLVKSTYAIIIIYICLQNIKWHLLKIMLLTSHFLTETVTSQTWPASRHSVIRLLCHSFKALTTDVILYLLVWSQYCKLYESRKYINFCSPLYPNHPAPNRSYYIILHRINA